MSLEFIISIILPLDICLIMFAGAMLYRRLDRHRSSLIPRLRDFDDRPTPKRRKENRLILEIVSIVFIAFGGIITSINLNDATTVAGGLGILGCGLFIQIVLRSRILRD